MAIWAPVRAKIYEQANAKAKGSMKNNKNCYFKGRNCKICNKQITKGNYCQSCEEFLERMRRKEGNT